MAEPSPDDIDLDACFEEVDGGAMAKGVWVQTMVLLPQCAAFQRGGVPLNDFVDSESCERLPLLRKEHRRCLLGRIGCFGQTGRYRKLGKWFKIKEAQNVGA